MIPLSYNLRNLRVRWKTTLMTVSGFALACIALVVMLACIGGVEEVCASSGQPQNVVVLSHGSVDEVLSRLPSDKVSQIEAARGVVRDARGKLLSSRELFLVVQPYRKELDEYTFLQLRGVMPVAFDVHNQVQLEQGSMFRPGSSEVIIGRAVQRSWGLQVGDRLTLGRREWAISGVFAADGSLESEVWGDLGEFASVFRRSGSYTSVVLKAESAAAARQIAEDLRGSRSLRVQAQTETDYYARQAEPVAVIRLAAWVISLMMAVGAVFGVMNTMYAAIGQRTKDIAVMRVVGFSSPQIVLAFLFETMIIAALGDVVGLAIGGATNGLTLSSAIGTMGREIEFAFRVDWRVMLKAGLVVLAMGVVGGIVPALSAVRVKALDALN